MSFFVRMTWSPWRHSLNLNGPLNTVGAVFSGALSIASSCPAAAYLPNTCVGRTYPEMSRSAGQAIALSVTVNFLGFAESILTPEISAAASVLGLPSLSYGTNSSKPAMCSKLLWRTLTLLMATSLVPVSQSWAMTGLPSLQLAFASISNV